MEALGLRAEVIKRRGVRGEGRCRLWRPGASQLVFRLPSLPLSHTGLGRGRAPRNLASATSAGLVA